VDQSKGAAKERVSRFGPPTALEVGWPGGEPMYDKWKKAVVHLEGATDSQSSSERMAALEKLHAELKAGGSPTEEQLAELSRGSRDVRSQGTAVFLRDDTTGSRYLIAARHVLHDHLEAERHLHEMASRYASGGDDSGMRAALDSAVNTIFRIIFRVPNLDELLAAGSRPPVLQVLMNLGAGVPWMHPYSFSHPDLDLAVVSLDGKHSSFTSKFGDELEAAGYAPLSTSVLSGDVPAEGEQVFTVGFPGTTSTLGRLALPDAIAMWASSFVSLPTFSFGRMAMVHSNLDYFWSDMTVYPGNSGGPVVAGQSLVGIVVQQAILNANGGPPQRVPFCKAIRAQHMIDLLAIQKAKDAAA
jgi:hypothetical protein